MNTGVNSVLSIIISEGEMGHVGLFHDIMIMQLPTIKPQL